MIQIKDDDKSSPELQALVENEIKQLLKVGKKKKEKKRRNVIIELLFNVIGVITVSITKCLNMIGW